MDAKTPASKIQQAFTELTLRLGGIFHEHPTDDDVIWAIARAVDTAYRRSVQSVSSPAVDPPAPAGEKHPAITHLLGSIATNSQPS